MTSAELARLLRRPLDELPDPLPLVPIERPFDVTIRPPGSKSLTNRALLIAALARGESVLCGALLDAEDAMVMIGALRALGAAIDVADENSGAVRVEGCAGRLKGGRTVNLAGAGTASRFLAAAACLADAPVTLDGNERMRQRPMGELVAMLRALGIKIDELGAPGCLPLRVHPARPTGGEIRVPTTLSSQFISALMMLGPFCTRGLTLVLEPPVTSPSYITMTARLMERMIGGASGGMRIDGSAKEGRIVTPPCDKYSCPPTEIEPDASGATSLWAAAAICPGSRCRTLSIGTTSLQGDAGAADVLARFGAAVRRDNTSTDVRGTGRLIGVDVDLSDVPDAAMAIGVVACLSEGPSVLHGLRTLRVKESDRVSAMVKEFGRIGARVEVLEGGGDVSLRITPAGAKAPDVSPVTFDTYNDHRMAMSLALIGLRRPNVFIRDPRCVAKTYPTFWSDLALLYDQKRGTN